MYSFCRTESYLLSVSGAASGSFSSSSRSRLREKPMFFCSFSTTKR